MPRSRPQSAREVIVHARQLLDDAKAGLAAVEGDDPSRRLAGMRGLAVFGRSVSQALDNLKSIDRPGYVGWFAPYKQTLSTDPLLIYFRTLRNQVLKELPPPSTASTHVSYFDTAMLEELRSSAPSNARGFFIGDEVGGSGWEIELPDGSVEKLYVALPANWAISVQMRLPDAPAVHLGNAVVDTSLANLGRLYVRYLDGLVDAAEARFCT